MSGENMVEGGGHMERRSSVRFTKQTKGVADNFK